MAESPFQREPIDRGYRILALSEGLQHLSHHCDDAEMAIRHIARAIEEEAAVLIDTLEKAEMSREQEAIDA
jgi:hypothetical protein